ncbi:MAG: substrate-binding domain-containing protein [Spirochaetales bacterium]|nr:substrate-binding domain-containing protein [Spirochaetales bacterium]
MTILLIGLVAILAAMLVFLVIINRKNRKYIDSTLLDECRSISDGLSQLAYGNLNIRCATDSLPENKALKKLQKQILRIKKDLNDVTLQPLGRVCYVGSDSFLEGQKAAHTLAELCHEEGKAAVVITVNLNISSLGLRLKGFTNILAKFYPKMQIIEVFEAEGKTDDAYGFVQQLARNNPDLKGIYVAGSSMGPITGKCVLDLKMQDSINVICHDLGEDIVHYIKQGAIKATVLQDPYAQGHDSLVHLFNHITAGWKPVQPRLLTEMDIVTKKNFAEYWGENGELKISEEMQNRLAKPVQKASQKIKIAVLGQDWNQFFMQIKKGSEDAIRELAAFNADVIWIQFNQAKRSEQEVFEHLKQIIKKLEAEKYSGIVTIIGQKNVVPLFNSAILQGIAVSTFNAEPQGLRGMLSWIDEVAQKLKNIGSEFSLGSSQVNSAMQQILDATQDIVKSTSIQKEIAENGVSSNETLAKAIGNIVKGEEKQVAIVRESDDISNKISDMINRFHDQLEGMNAVKKEVSVSSEKMTEMSTYSKEISKIVAKIEEISSKTSILALNAAIQAARAGEHGKGFKVVSDEIGRLAVQSVEATNEAVSFVQNLQDAAEISVESISRSSKEVGHQVEEIFGATSNMEALSKQLVTTMDMVKEVAERNTGEAMDLKKSSDSLSEIVSQTSVVSQENSTATEQLSATTAEITAQMNSIARQTEVLADIINVLEGSIGQFTLD